MATFLGTATDFVGSQLRVPQRDDGHGNETAVYASPEHHSSIIQSL
jgi:hypothetical protein